MAITRRTARFAELAAGTERECLARGVILPPGVVDSMLNECINKVAHAMRLSPRTALDYATDELPASLADDVATALLSAKPEQG